MNILCKPFICLPISKWPVKYVHESFKFLRHLNLNLNQLILIIWKRTFLSIGYDCYWPLVTKKVKMGKPGEPAAIILVGF